MIGKKLNLRREALMECDAMEKEQQNTCISFSKSQTWHTESFDWIGGELLLWLKEFNDDTDSDAVTIKTD